MLSARPTPAVGGAYFSGAVLGAAIPAILLIVIAGLLSPLPMEIRAVGVIVILVLLAVRSLGMVQFRLPQNARQIPEYVFADRPERAAFRFAFELGTGLRTYLTSTAPYAVAAAAALLYPSSWPAVVGAAALLAVGFAGGRSVVVVGQMTRRSVLTRPRPAALHGATALTFVGCAVLALRALGVI